MHAQDMEYVELRTCAHAIVIGKVPIVRVVSFLGRYYLFFVMRMTLLYACVRIFIGLMISCRVIQSNDLF